MKKIILPLILFLFTGVVNAQFTKNYELNGGVVIQKTLKLYWENGIGADYTSDFLLNKKIHLKAAYVTSVLGSAMGTNAIKQGSFTLGANWHFFHTRPLQIFAGLNTGYFAADYEEEVFDVLPHKSLMLQLEGGLTYKFNASITASLSAGYNLITGDGVNGPGTLFPLFYQLKVFYRFK